MLLIGDRLRSQGIAVDIAPGRPDATVHAGRVRLEQVLINLLQNAAEAMQGRPDARIAVRVHGRDPLCIDVCDNGPGVPEALKRSEEHTSELPSLLRTPYAVICLKKKKK